MAAEENRFVTYIIPPFPVQERILRNKTWQDLGEIWWLFSIKQLFHSRLLDMRLIKANSALRAWLAIYHLISNARSWNNC